MQEWAMLTQVQRLRSTAKRRSAEGLRRSRLGLACGKFLPMPRVRKDCATLPRYPSCPAVRRTDTCFLTLIQAWFDRTAKAARSEEHTSALQSLMRISYAVFCLKKKTNHRSYA